MPSLSGRTLRRRPDLAAARAWRASVPEAVRPAPGRGSAVLLVLVAFLMLTVIPISPGFLSWSALLPLVVISGVTHRPGDHALVVAACLGVVLVGGVLGPVGDPEAVGALIAASIISTITMWRSLARARVGVHGTRGEAVLDDLRSALERRGELPPLEPGWTVEGCVSSAHGHPFSGDFIVSAYDAEARTLEVALVDVSGKGLRAASRAVQLSDALDALIGAVPAADFLTCANDYVLRQGWDEGYATAVHLEADLATGEYRIRRAGHPPPLEYRCASDSWRVVDDASGPALGFLDRPRYPPALGVLDATDAVLLYSDGLVERPERHLDDGIADFMGSAGALAGRGFGGGSRRLCEAVRGEADDRAVVILWHAGAGRA